jgi:S-formylglutathione hydrolase FrmB
MENIKVTSLPVEYGCAVGKEFQGTVSEVSYSVGNYINELRQLVTNQNIKSEEAGRDTIKGNMITKKCSVYLPACYDPNDKDTRYNVLYLLHGVGGNCNEWLSDNGKTDENFIICNIFDNLIANGEIDPMIIVFPDGRSACDWTDRSFNPEGTNMLGFYYLDYELRYDLIPFIEAKYNTYAKVKDTSPEGIAYNRLHRAIGGLSMGGMQALNLILGGYRCDSEKYSGAVSQWKNGLDTTVLAPGMLDLFAYVGAFSNAPTSSEGEILGASIAVCGCRLNLLYITCGVADEIAYNAGFEVATTGLVEAAGNNLGDYYQVSIKDGLHDFNVWNNGAYNFIRLSFGKSEDHLKTRDINVVL